VRCGGGEWLSGGWLRRAVRESRVLADWFRMSPLGCNFLDWFCVEVGSKIVHVRAGAIPI